MKESTRCCQYYLRNFKTKNIEPILSKIYPCLFCSSCPSNRIGSHLLKNKSCLEKYFARYKVENLKDLLSKLEKLKRKLRPSRQKAKRKIEYEVTTARKKERENSTKTTVDLINQYRRETSFSNVRHCYNCSGNFSDSRAELVKDTDTEEFHNILISRRFQQFFLCNQCKSQNIVPYKTLDSNVKVQKIIVENKSTIFSPHMLDECLDNKGVDLKTPITCMFPVTVECLTDHDTSKIKSRSSDERMIYKNEVITEQLVEVLYENELAKYKRAKEHGDRYQGRIEDGVLAHTEKMVMDFVIIGSESWQNIENNNMFHRFEQHGCLCYKLTIKLPVSQDIIATSLLQDGLVISVEYVGSATSELETVYMVHIDHGNDVDCTPDCRKTRLETYLLDNPFDIQAVHYKYLSSYISSAQLKLNSFIRNFVKSPVSDLHSDNYKITVEYNLDGSIELSGFIWPNKLEELNIQFANYPIVELDQDVVIQSLNYVDTTLTCSTDTEHLMEYFNLSQMDADHVSALAQEYQFHYCHASDCNKCQEAALPSLETCFVRIPVGCYSINLGTAEKLKKIMVNKLKQLSANEVFSLTTEEWLKDIDKSIEIEVNRKVIKVKIEEDLVLRYFIDTVLQNLMEKYTSKFVAVYHYSISCGNIFDAYKVVMKRLFIVDCYTQPFNIDLLKIFKSPINVAGTNGQSTSNKNHSVPRDLSDIIDNKIISTHNEISVLESYALFDKNICKSASSTSVEYINSLSERKSYFKRVSRESDKTYKVEGSRDVYEKLNSNIDKYLARENCPFITLAEFVSLYDFIGHKESESLYKLLSVPGVQIKNSSFISAFSPTDCLPEFIFTKNKEVMKIRKNRKIISYPCNESDSAKTCYTKAMLYYPSSHELTQDEAEDIVKLVTNANDNTPIVKHVER